MLPPGWTGVTENTTLPTPIKTDCGEITEAVTKITWTATAEAEIKADQFQEFEVSMGPLPQVDQVIKALQTYSDSDIVCWIDQPKADGPEPEHLAPVLKLAKGTGDARGDATDTEAAAHDDHSGSGGARAGQHGLLR